MKALFLVLVILTSTNVFANEQERDARAIQALIESAKQLAAADLGCETDNDCTAIAVGKRACGGPAGYIKASLLNSNIEEVNYLAESSVQKQKAYNARYRVFSICSVVLPPTVQCVKKLCK